MRFDGTPLAEYSSEIGIIIDNTALPYAISGFVMPGVVLQNLKSKIQNLKWYYRLTLIHVFPVPGFLNVSHPVGLGPKMAFIAFETRL